MENNSKVFAMAMLFVLAVAAASNTSSGVKYRDLSGADKGDGKPNEPQKVASSSPPISPPIQNAAARVQGNTSPPPPPSQSSPNSGNSDSSSSKSPPLMDSSTKPVPPESLNSGASKQGEDNASMNPPVKEEHKASEALKKEDDKPAQSPGKEDHKAPQDPEKGGDMTSQARTKDNEPKGSQGVLQSGSSGDKSKIESCEAANASSFTCQKGVLAACLLQHGIESTAFFLLVQNTGADDLNVNIESPSEIKIDSKSLNLPKHSNKKVNLTGDASKGLIIHLNTGEGETCVLQSKTSISDWLPAYAAHVTPMHGAYFLFASIIIIGGTWACCKFRKTEKRVDAGIPYHQLEMATHTQSASVAVNEVPADSWDQSWDDDWDDEEAVVRTAGKQPTKNVPSNGLSSRSANPNKDGWESDWDD